GLRARGGARLRSDHRSRQAGRDPRRSGRRRRVPRDGRGQRSGPLTALLEVSGLTVGYDGVPVLHGVDLRLPAGSICAVLGANGAGKTTLLRTVSGLVRPSGGRIVHAGAELRDVPVPHLVRRGLAHLPEGRGAVAGLTVVEDLRLGGHWR